MSNTGHPDFKLLTVDSLSVSELSEAVRKIRKLNLLDNWNLEQKESVRAILLECKLG